MRWLQLLLPYGPILVFLLALQLSFVIVASSATITERVILQLEESSFAYSVGQDTPTTSPTTTTPLTTTTTRTTATTTTTQPPASTASDLNPTVVLTGSSSVPIPLFQGILNAQKVIVQLPFQPSKDVHVTFDALVVLTSLPTIYAGTNPFASTYLTSLNTLEEVYRNESKRFVSRVALEVEPREVVFRNTTAESLRRIVTVWARSITEVLEKSQLATTTTTTKAATTTTQAATTPIPSANETTTTNIPTATTTTSTTASSSEDGLSAFEYAYVGEIQLVARVQTDASEVDAEGHSTESLPGDKLYFQVMPTFNVSLTTAQSLIPRLTIETDIQRNKLTSGEGSAAVVLAPGEVSGLNPAIATDLPGINRFFPSTLLDMTLYCGGEGAGTPLQLFTNHIPLRTADQLLTSVKVMREVSSSGLALSDLGVFTSPAFTSFTPLMPIQQNFTLICDLATNTRLVDRGLKSALVEVAVVLGGGVVTTVPTEFSAGPSLLVLVRRLETITMTLSSFATVGSDRVFLDIALSSSVDTSTVASATSPVLALRIISTCADSLRLVDASSSGSVTTTTTASTDSPLILISGTTAQKSVRLLASSSTTASDSARVDTCVVSLQRDESLSYGVSMFDFTSNTQPIQIYEKSRIFSVTETIPVEITDLEAYLKQRYSGATFLSVSQTEVESSGISLAFVADRNTFAGDGGYTLPTTTSATKAESQWVEAQLQFGRDNTANTASTALNGGAVNGPLVQLVGSAMGALVGAAVTSNSANSVFIPKLREGLLRFQALVLIYNTELIAYNTLLAAANGSSIADQPPVPPTPPMRLVSGLDPGAIGVTTSDIARHTTLLKESFSSLYTSNITSSFKGSTSYFTVEFESLKSLALLSGSSTSIDWGRTEEKITIVFTRYSLTRNDTDPEVGFNNFSFYISPNEESLLTAQETVAGTAALIAAVTAPIAGVGVAVHFSRVYAVMDAVRCPDTDWYTTKASSLPTFVNAFNQGVGSTNSEASALSTSTATTTITLHRLDYYVGAVVMNSVVMIILTLLFLGMAVILFATRIDVVSGENSMSYAASRVRFPGVAVFGLLYFVGFHTEFALKSIAYGHRPANDVGEDGGNANAVDASTEPAISLLIRFGVGLIWLALLTVLTVAFAAVFYRKHQLVKFSRHGYCSTIPWFLRILDRRGEWTLSRRVVEVLNELRSSSNNKTSILGQHASSIIDGKGGGDEAAIANKIRRHKKKSEGNVDAASTISSMLTPSNQSRVLYFMGLFGALFDEYTGTFFYFLVLEGIVSLVIGAINVVEPTTALGCVTKHGFLLAAFIFSFILVAAMRPFNFHIYTAFYGLMSGLEVVCMAVIFHTSRKQLESGETTTTSNTIIDSEATTTSDSVFVVSTEKVVSILLIAITSLLLAKLTLDLFQFILRQVQGFLEMRKRRKRGRVGSALTSKGGVDGSGGSDEEELLGAPSSRSHFPGPGGDDGEDGGDASVRRARMRRAPGHRTRSIHESQPGGAYLPAGMGIAVADDDENGRRDRSAASSLHEPPPPNAGPITRLIKVWKKAREAVAGGSKKKRRGSTTDRRNSKSSNQAQQDSEMMMAMDLPPVRAGYKRLRVSDFLPPNMNPYGEGAVMDIVDDDFVPPAAQDDDNFPVEAIPRGGRREMMSGGGRQIAASKHVSQVDHAATMTEGDNFIVYCPTSPSKTPKTDSTAVRRE